MQYIKNNYEEFITCAGIEIEPGMYSGCQWLEDCPVCHGTGRVECCPRCGDSQIIISNGNMACLGCDFDIRIIK